MHLDTLMIATHENQDNTLASECHIIAGLRDFIQKYPRALFALDYRVASRLVNLEDGAYEEPEHPNQRINYIDYTRSTSTSRGIINHLGSLPIGYQKGRVWYFRPKEHHARVLAHSGYGVGDITDGMLNYGSIDHEFRTIYDAKEANELNYYYIRGFNVCVPSPLPHPTAKPEPAKKEQFVADNGFYYNVTVNWADTNTNTVT